MQQQQQQQLKIGDRVKILITFLNVQDWLRGYKGQEGVVTGVVEETSFPYYVEIGKQSMGPFRMGELEVLPQEHVEQMSKETWDKAMKEVDEAKREN